MKRLLFFLFFSPLFATSQGNIFDDFDAFFKENVVFGLVDYGRLKDNPGQLVNLASKIEVHNPQDSSMEYQTAFYINTYNLLVIKQVVDNYPIRSPKEINGFFDKTSYVVAGEELTLDQIEHKKLIEATGDPRIHFSLGCAARSCPFLYSNAYYPSQLNDLLETRAKQIIELPSYVFVENDKKQVSLCKVFEWYRDQFETTSGSLIKFINQYKVTKVPEVYKVAFREYDWSLNDR